MALISQPGTPPIPPARNESPTEILPQRPDGRDRRRYQPARLPPAAGLVPIPGGALRQAERRAEPVEALSGPAAASSSGRNVAMSSARMRSTLPPRKLISSIVARSAEYTSSKTRSIEWPAKLAPGARRPPRPGPSSRRPGDAPEGAPARAPCRAGAPAGRGWGGDRRSR